MDAEILHKALENLEGSCTYIYGKFEAGEELDDLQLIKTKRQHDNFLLVAERLLPAIKGQLQKEGIAYLEENGNFFLKTDDSFFFIDSNKPIKKKKDTAKKGFTKTGLKRVFGFLLEPELINANQRSIAEKSGVSLGTVPGGN